MSLFDHPIDRLLTVVDRSLKRQIPMRTTRPSPATHLTASPLSKKERTHSAGLMRINHTGEVCAQALYQAQALTARTAAVSEGMHHAAEEEIDHLQWCEERLKELNSHKSHLNPLWYAGAFAIGALAGLAGDRWSLGFVAETEDQVAAHLEDHLQQLPTSDTKSRAIVTQMKEDEQQHALAAKAHGASPLPQPIKGLMHLSARLMKTIVYRF